MKSFYSLVAMLLLFAGSTIAQVPILNSNPTAKPVIFLDFDGHTVSGTSWNVSGPIYCGPSNLNKDQITEVFNRVAEDYRPFNLNITTDSTRYWSAPVKQRMRLILTITSDWYGNVGGVAYTNSFSKGDNTPCFVFTALHKYNVKNISEAASHEAGHTLGLRHQSAYDPICNKVEEYNSGTGSGAIGWAPIMGVGYYRNQTTWHNGPNPYGCTNAQDDLGIITSATNGFGYRIDDHAADFAKATKTVMQNKQMNAVGLIGTNNDEDMFAVTVPATGKLKLDAVPYNVGTSEVGSNLDVQLKLYSVEKSLLQVYNPAETLSATIDTVLTAGTYYVTVSGTGNQYTPEYASLGAYTIQGSFVDMSPLPLRKLEIKGQVDGQRHKLSWVIDADEAVVTQTLEASTNGRDFKPVTNLSVDARTYSYLPATTNALQYRIQVTFDNGKQHYSNTIALRNGAAEAKPKLVSNLIQSTNLMIYSPSTFAYTITDMNGKVVSSGRVSEGASSIQTGILANGLYVIRFTNGNEQVVEKFTKQ